MAQQQQVRVIRQTAIKAAGVDIGVGGEDLGRMEPYKHAYDFTFTIHDKETGRELRETGRIRITGGGQIHFQVLGRTYGWESASDLFRQLPDIKLKPGGATETQS